MVSLSSRKSSFVPTRTMGVLVQWWVTSGNHWKKGDWNVGMKPRKHKWSSYPHPVYVTIAHWLFSPGGHVTTKSRKNSRYHFFFDNLTNMTDLYPFLETKEWHLLFKAILWWRDVTWKPRLLFSAYKLLGDFYADHRSLIFFNHQFNIHFLYPYNVFFITVAPSTLIL